MMKLLIALVLAVLPSTAAFADTGFAALPGYYGGSGIHGGPGGSLAAENAEFTYDHWALTTGPLVSGDFATFGEGSTFEWAGGGTFEWQFSIGTCPCVPHILWLTGTVDGARLVVGPYSFGHDFAGVFVFDLTLDYINPDLGMAPGQALLQVVVEPPGFLFLESPGAVLASPSGASLTSVPTTPVPEPSTWLLLGSGLIALALRPYWQSR